MKVMNSDQQEKCLAEFEQLVNKAQRLMLSSVTGDSQDKAAIAREFRQAVSAFEAVCRRDTLSEEASSPVV